jgi:hypothetical protein
MNGKALYGMWDEANSQIDCSVEPWESLDDTDKLVWELFADKVTSSLGQTNVHTTPGRQLSIWDVAGGEGR